MFLTLHLQQEPLDEQVLNWLVGFGVDLSYTCTVPWPHVRREDQYHEWCMQRYSALRASVSLQLVHS